MLREAVRAGEISWGVARLVVAHVSPETQQACREAMRGRTVRAAAAIVAAYREAGEPLPVWACAERIAAEAASALGRGAPGEGPSARDPGPARRRADAARGEHGIRERAFPDLPWAAGLARIPEELAELGEIPADCAPRELDRRFRRALASFQSLDLEAGRILRQMVDRSLFAELGFASLARYATERLDVSPRTARRLVALARAEHPPASSSRWVRTRPSDSAPAICGT